MIEDENLSMAWARAFYEVARTGGKEITPLSVTITGFSEGEPFQIPQIKEKLDTSLQEHGKYSTDTVSSTLFPSSLWNRNIGRRKLYERYLQLLPTLKKCAPANRHGLYFERLIAYGDEKLNQLDHIIRTYKGGNHRRSALQALIFLPSVDHTHQRRRGFPCMQQVMFIPNKSELSVTGVYATQYLYERAYGNYLGLSRLGQFVAHELDLELARVTCITGVAQLGNVRKRDITDLLQTISDLLAVRAVA